MDTKSILKQFFDWSIITHHFRWSWNQQTTALWWILNI